jgi:hypothetical protein
LGKEKEESPYLELKITIYEKNDVPQPQSFTFSDILTLHALKNFF